MVIGIDTSRAFGESKTGTENYSYHLVKAMLGLPESRTHQFVLFTRPKAVIPSEIKRYSHVSIKTIQYKYLWTQLGLAWETWGKPALDVLFIPAHTLPVLRPAKLRTVVTIHGLEYQWLPEYQNWLQRWYLPLSTYYAASHASTLIAVSQFTKKQLVKELHTPSNKIKVIYEGVQGHIPTNQQTNRSMRKTLRKYGLQDKQYVLFVGTIQPRKNLRALVEAFSRLENDLSGYKLVLAGSVGWMSSEVMQAPSAYNIGERVVFCGRVSEAELRDLYLGASLYVQPSITEGFGLPVLEAMEALVPVVCSDGGALREVVGESGIVVALGPGFEDRLTKAMGRVLRNPKLATRLATMGKKRAHEFSWDKAAKESLKVLLSA